MELTISRSTAGNIAPAVDDSQLRPSCPGRGAHLLLLVIFLMTAAVLLPANRSAADGGPAGAPSPTGRNPRLAWTPQRQAVWNQMVQNNHPWWQRLKSFADVTATPAGFSGDTGGYAVLAYQMTGNPVYAQKAWTCLQPYMGYIPPDRNFTRQAFTQFVWEYDWLYPALTADQRTAYINTLNQWADMVLGYGNLPGWGTRTTDSDETVGHYFGLAALDLATAPDNPRAGTFLADAQVGGLTATASNVTSTFRNAVRHFVDLANGGEWIESTMYDENTLQLLLFGEECVKTAVGGQDYFPEITRFIPQAAVTQIDAMAPDLTQVYEWGDDEEPRTLQNQARVTLLGMLAGLSQNDPVAGPCAHQFTEEFAHLGPALDPYSLGLTPGGLFFLFYNPYAPQSDWRPVLAPGRFAPGRGMTYYHTGWTGSDSLFGAHMAPATEVDHGVSYFANFQLYRKGEWALTQPLGYGGTAISALSANSMLHAGLPAAYEQRGVVAQEFGAAHDYAYQAGTTGGQYYGPGYYAPPPAAIHEWTRSCFYLPSADRTVDTVVVYDRSNADDPRSLPSYDRYAPDERNAIESAPARKQWIVHTPVSPSLTADGIAWTTPGGQQVRVNTLLPASPRRSVLDETQALGPSGNYFASELKYQVRLMPAVDQPWDTFLNVVQAADAGVTLQNELVRSTLGEAEGTLVHRVGQADALVLFGARQGARVNSQGYTVNWTGQADTVLYLVDLDPAKVWSGAVDGKAAGAVTVSGNGVARLVVPGAGPHSLRIVVNGLAPDSTPPAVPSGLTATPGSGSALLAWTANTEADLAGYYVYRAATASGPWQRLTSTPISSPSFNDTGLTNGTTYWYAVSAIDLSSNETQACAPVSVMPTDASATYSVSGQVTVNGTGKAGVQITCGACVVATAGDGTYTVPGLNAGIYSVSASDAGCTFSAAQSVKVGPSQIGVNFTGKQSSFSISGIVTNNGAPMAGVNVLVWGTGLQTVSAADGSYTLSGFSAGTYLVDAVMSGYSFNEPAVTVGPDQVGVNLAASKNYKICGKIYQHGAPAPGATVAVFGTGISTVSAADGTYTLAWFGAGSYPVTCFGPGYTFMQGTQQVTVGPDQMSVNFSDAPLSFSISGSVTAGGSALAGVTVAAGNQSATTAADGTYALNGLAAGTYTVNAALKEYTFSGPVSATIGPNATGVNFTGTRNTYGISGSVTVNGTGLAGATVVAGNQSAVTAADGSYALAGFVSGSYSVSASLAEYTVSAPQTVALGPNAAGINFTATRKTYSVSGQVTTAGNGLANVTVSAGSQSAVTAADGSYTINGLVSGSYTVSASLAEYTFSAPQSVTVGPNATGVNFTATRVTYTVSGSVTVGGAGLAGATVTAGGQTATTAADGSYKLSGLTSGTYTVSAALAEYNVSAPQSVTLGPNATGVNFTATRVTYTVSGTVTTGGSGLAGVTVSAGGQTATTTSSGSYTLSGLTSGSYTVSAAVAEYTMSAPQNVTIGPSASGINFTAVRNTYTISGSVTVSGVSTGWVTVSAGSATTVAAVNGSYTLTGLVSGTYTVSASMANCTFSASHHVTVGPSAAGVNFSGAASSFTISGKVTYNGQPLAAVIVSNGSQSIITKADGAYSFPNLAAGTYSVSASRWGCDCGAAQSVKVGPSQSNVNFNTTKLPYFAICGTVTVNGQGVAGVTVAVFGTGIATTTAADGSYALTGFNAGTYTVDALKYGYSFPEANATVGPDQTSVNIAGQSTYVIAGKVLCNGKPVSGVTVAVWYSGQSCITGADGSYMLGGFVAGTYSVSAFKAGYSIPDLRVTVGPDQTNANITATALTPSVRGKRK